jgi:hypothetical protein
METRQERTFKAALFFGDFIPLEIAAGRGIASRLCDFCHIANFLEHGLIDKDARSLL